MKGKGGVSFDRYMVARWVEKGPVRIKKRKNDMFVGDEVDLAWCNVI